MYVAFLNLTCSLRELPLLTIRRGSRGVRAPARDISNGWVGARKRAGLLPHPCTHTFRSTESAATTKASARKCPVRQNPQQAPSPCAQTPRSAESAATTKASARIRPFGRIRSNHQVPARKLPIRRNPQQPPKPLRAYVTYNRIRSETARFSDGKARSRKRA